MGQTRSSNSKLAAAIAEADWSHSRVANAFKRVAAESGAQQFATVGRSHVSHWVAGSIPSGTGPLILAEAFSRRLGRIVTPSDIGLTTEMLGGPDWNADTLTALIDLGRMDVNMERRQILKGASYSVLALTLPNPSWWTQFTGSRNRTSAGSLAVGRGDVEAVREMVSLFSRVDQRRGGGHARSAVVQYLTNDVASYLHGKYADDGVRKEMYSAAGELAYLAGWMAFDSEEHAVAQRYFTVAVKLAAEANDPPLAGHILRAMAHQAIDLGHFQQGLDLATASIDGKRYQQAGSRERALLGVVHAKALGSAGQPKAAATALNKAEVDLAAAEPVEESPSRMFFFGEASLAHETACTLRDTGDLPGAIREFRRSVRERKAATFTRTHAVTLGYLGATQARCGNLEEACATWSDALDVIESVRSRRAGKIAVEMRSALSPFRGRGTSVATRLDERVTQYLEATRST